MELFDKKAECHGCSKCQAVCTENAIVMEEDEEGFLYPTVLREKCIACGRCLSACEELHVTKGEEGSFYAVRCQDEQLLKKSTSGGAFSLIAQEVLAQGGLVCGAVMDEKLTVVHQISDCVSGMRKSKYVQSDIQHMYGEMRRLLQGGRKLLFTGTPCQCQAVKTFFAGYEKQLIIASLICRGVQSPLLWREYLWYLGKSAPVTSYDFRDKSCCDDAHMVAYRLGKEKHLVSMHTDPFSLLYGKCLSFRPSCYQCEFCRTDLPFDFTIGDFWGIEKVFPELADGKGTSLVIARGERAENIMQGLRDKAYVFSGSKEECLQPALQSPAAEPAFRKLLFKGLSVSDEEGHCDMALILNMMFRGRGRGI